MVLLREPDYRRGRKDRLVLRQRIYKYSLKIELYNRHSCPFIKWGLEYIHYLAIQN